MVTQSQVSFASKMIDKIGWLLVQDQKVLMVRSQSKDKFYAPGGKREAGESDEQALVREIKEELGVDIVPATIKHLQTFKAQAHGQPEGVFVQIAGYGADYTGELQPQSEIEEMTWFTSADYERATEPGKLILSWLKEQGLIR
ncbi:MAG: NUDIX domain-containing protein [Candidatus Pacebacteria bacterium]|nr:NUDIX domain-containing protein [Candidatus Paceibacterota bacterium]